MLRIAVVIAITLTSACAAKPSVSEYQCRAGDWQSLGYRDGSRGMARTQILTHQEACGGFGIVPDRALYLAGWETGLSSYCTQATGYDLGLRGRSLNTVCQDSQNTGFADAYTQGRVLYQARNEVRRLSQSLAQHEQRLEQIKQEIVGAGSAQLVPDLSLQERLALVAKVQSLADERASINAKLPELEYSLQEAQVRLNKLDQLHASR